MIVGVFHADVPQEVEFAVHVQFPVADQDPLKEGFAADLLAFDEQVSEAHQCMVKVLLFYAGLDV